MTRNRRIFLNIIATYGRSLYALIVGLFCGRWVLMALGAENYGLIGLIGGLVAFMGLLNGVVSSAMGRFFAVAIGEEGVDYKTGLNRCRGWFAASIMGSVVLPSMILVIGYPIGIYLIKDFLNIPIVKVHDCLWVWRFTCLSFFVTMATMPFNAMYVAKQYIAELTVYNVFATTANVAFAFYMINHPRNWLVGFSLWTCVVTVMPALLIAIRGYFIMPECRIELRHLRCWDSFKRMLSFSGWNMISIAGGMIAKQGSMIAINKFFGAIANAGVNIGNIVAGHTATLSGSLISSLSPAIMTAFGANERTRVEAFAYRTSKIAALCVYIFAIPLSLEISKVLSLWLKDVPDYAMGCCLIAMLDAVIDKYSIGHLIAINANGEIAKYQTYVGSAWIFAIPLGVFLALLGGGVYSVMIALLIARVYVVAARVWFGHRLVGLNIKYWVARVCVPLLVVGSLAAISGYVLRSLFSPSITRVLLVTFATEVVLLPLSWLFVLDASERDFVLAKLKRIFQ